MQQNPDLRAIVWDRPEVLKVAREMVEAYGVADRVDLVPGDMFADPVPGRGRRRPAVERPARLGRARVPGACSARCAAALPAGGRLLIHDVFLNDDLDGPLPVALYSAALFTLTEGRAYSAGEYRGWLREAGLAPADRVVPTLVHCGVLEGRKLPPDRFDTAPECGT